VGNVPVARQHRVDAQFGAGKFGEDFLDPFRGEELVDDEVRLAGDAQPWAAACSARRRCWR
jgi:hypothetical protein